MIDLPEVSIRQERCNQRKAHKGMARRLYSLTFVKTGYTILCFYWKHFFPAEIRDKLTFLANKGKSRN